MTSISAWNSVEGLPKQFVKSLRVLFDILDEQHCGFVRLQDIESRWHEEGVKGLPSGVTDALRKVTPQNGYLSFDRFVAGLKLALLTSKNNNVHYRKDGLGSRENGNHGQQSNKIPRQQRPVSYPNHHQAPWHSCQEKENREDLVDRRTARSNKTDIPPPPKRNGHNHNHPTPHQSNTAAVRPNNVLNSMTDPASNSRRDIKSDDIKYPQREKSVPLQTVNRAHGSLSPVSHSSLDGYNSGKHIESRNPPQVPPRDKSKRIIGELKNWQRRVNDQQLPSSTGTIKPTPYLQHVSSDSGLLDKDGHRNGVYANVDQVHGYRETTDDRTQSVPGPQKATVRRQNSARRHTLSSGVDFSMIKRMKQLEQEKEVLLQGLEMTERARDWYHKNVMNIEDKLKYVGKTSYNDNNLESNQERMNFQEARVKEINQQLQTLIDSSEKGFPLHMNLHMSSKTSMNQPSSQHEQTTIKMLKEQNRLLTQEVGQKEEKIAKLEKEKSTLVRDLFDSRSKNKPANYDDTTFM